MLNKTILLFAMFGALCALPVDEPAVPLPQPVGLLPLKEAQPSKGAPLASDVLPEVELTPQEAAKGDLETANTFWGGYGGGYYRQPYFGYGGGYGNGYSGWRRGWGGGGYYGRGFGSGWGGYGRYWG